MLLCSIMLTVFQVLFEDSGILFLLQNVCIFSNTLWLAKCSRFRWFLLGIQHIFFDLINFSCDFFFFHISGFYKAHTFIFGKCLKWVTSKFPSPVTAKYFFNKKFQLGTQSIPVAKMVFVAQLKNMNHSSKIWNIKWSFKMGWRLPFEYF